MTGHTQSDWNVGRLLWIQAAPLAEKLDSATWLETTRLLRERGWRVDLFCEGKKSGPQTIKGVDVICFRRPNVYFVGSAMFHLQVIWELSRHLLLYDIVLFHQMTALWMMPVWVLRRLTGRRQPLLLLDTRDLPTFETGMKSKLRQKFFSMVHRLANFFADGQLAITQEMAELVGIPEESLIGIWPSGVDIDAFRSVRVDRTWPTAGETVELLYIGKLHLERNLLPMCEAVRTARKAGMAIRLSLVGSGPDEHFLRNLASSADGAIRVLPPVPHTEVPTLLARAHVGVTSFPAVTDRKFAASSPIKLFEYLAAGLPVLASANICHTNVVGKGEYAFWVHDPTEEGVMKALEQLWAKRDALPRLSVAASQAAEDWTWDASAGKLSTALSSALPTYMDERAAVHQKFPRRQVD